MADAETAPVKGQNGGFTLLELVLAMAILAGSFVTLLVLRTSAVDRASEYTRDRHIQRLAEEKLSEVVAGLEDQVEGAFEAEQDGIWRVEVQNLGDLEAPLYAATLTITYPTGAEEEAEYSLTMWLYHVAGESVLREIVEEQGEGFGDTLGGLGGFR